MGRKAFTAALVLQFHPGKLQRQQLPACPCSGAAHVPPSCHSLDSLSTSRTQTPCRSTMCLWDTCLIMLAVSKNAWGKGEKSHPPAAPGAAFQEFHTSRAPRNSNTSKSLRLVTRRVSRGGMCPTGCLKLGGAGSSAFLHSQLFFKSYPCTTHTRKTLAKEMSLWLGSRTLSRTRISFSF